MARSVLKYIMKLAKKTRTASWFYEKRQILTHWQLISTARAKALKLAIMKTARSSFRFLDQSDQKNGTAQWFYDTGDLMEEVPWVNDEKNGTEKVYYQSGPLKYETPYTNGKINGTKKGYYRKYSAQIRNSRMSMTWNRGQNMSTMKPARRNTRTAFIDGLRNGMEKAYHTDGSLSSETPWNNGVRHGLEKV
ncbi:MAG: hypothetical protein U5K27_06060 [Desulfotignum sp.]|nr:hypothetical protein [Desulfotignum sp.]